MIAFTASGVWRLAAPLMLVVAPTSASPSPYRGTVSKSKLTGVDFPAGLHAAAQRRLRRPPAPPCASAPPMIAIYREKLSRSDLCVCIASPRSDWLLQLAPSPPLPSPRVVCSSGGDGEAVMLAVSLKATEKLTRSC